MCVPQQFTLETGARYAAELLHAWVLRVAAESRAAAPLVWARLASDGLLI